MAIATAPATSRMPSQVNAKIGSDTSGDGLYDSACGPCLENDHHVQRIRLRIGGAFTTFSETSERTFPKRRHHPASRRPRGMGWTEHRRAHPYAGDEANTATYGYLYNAYAANPQDLLLKWRASNYAQFALIDSLAGGCSRRSIEGCGCALDRTERRSDQ